MRVNKTKKILLILFPFLFGLNLLFAQEMTTPPPIQDPNAPEITFEKIVYDYGTIKKESNGTCEFKFKNTGRTPLILSGAKASCGCTVPSWPTEPIAPGRTGVIKVTYDTKRIGVINKQIIVTSNAKTQSIVLTIKGNVIE
jgi:hypothetical protein